MSTRKPRKKNADYSDTHFPPAARIWETIRNGSRTNREINPWLELYSPSSAGSARARSEQTLISARDTIPLLCDLMRSHSRRPIEMRAVQSACTNENARHAAEEMARLLTARGSDKATVHDYHHLYGAVLVTVRETEAAVLEIGLGTNNTDMVSNMGPAGVPGASLRAFRDFLPRGQVFGADVDKRILFSEERIGTFYVDQTKPNSFGALDTNLGGRLFDLVIDEGLHSPNANIATLTFALQKLKPGGHAVMEDIHARSLLIWDLLGMILPRDYVASIPQAKEGFLFVVRKAAH